MNLYELVKIFKGRWTNVDDVLNEKPSTGSSNTTRNAMHINNTEAIWLSENIINLLNDHPHTDTVISNAYLSPRYKIRFIVTWHSFSLLLFQADASSFLSHSENVQDRKKLSDLIIPLNCVSLWQCNYLVHFKLALKHMVSLQTKIKRTFQIFTLGTISVYPSLPQKPIFLYKIIKVE